MNCLNNMKGFDTMSEKVETTEVKKPRKKATTTKSTTAKAKEEVVEQVAPQPQMTPDMMAMFAQFAQFMQMQQQAQVVQPVVEVEKKPTRVKKIKSTSTKGMTKQAVRRKWKGTEVYLTSVVPGTVSYKGKLDTYGWDYLGDSQPVSIEDVISMPDSFLKKPLLEISEGDNEEELLDDLITCLGLESMYEHLFILDTLENDIENINMEKLKEVLATSKEEGHDLEVEVTAIVQSKINNKELLNYHAISEFEKLLGRSFNK